MLRSKDKDIKITSSKKINAQFAEKSDTKIKNIKSGESIIARRSQKTPRDNSCNSNNVSTSHF